jgi:PKD repeat protein
MFPRIVSRLSLSPSAMSDLAFYARRLRQESVTRTFSAIAAVLIVGLQFATIMVPPSPTNAASPNDIIYGGFINKNDLLNRYDGSAELQALYNYMGISRSDVSQAHEATINSRDHSLISMGRNQHTASDGKITLGSHTYWTRGLYVWDTGANVARGSTYRVLEGTRARDGGYFAVMFQCGNIVFKTLPPKPTPPPPPKPTPTVTPHPTPSTPPTPKPTVTCVQLTGNTTSGVAPVIVNFTGVGVASGQTITDYLFDFGDNKTLTTASPTATHTYTAGGKWTATLKVKGSTGTVSAAIPACSFTINTTTPPAAYSRSKAAQNLTQNLDATTRPAHAADDIRYTLTTKNIGGTTDGYTVVEHVEDILEYADITDLGGATIKDGVMTWPETPIAPGKSILKTFTIKVKSPIPATPVGRSDKFSYDLRMDNIYGNEVHINLEVPLAKQVEGASTNLPDTGASTATLIVLTVSALTLFFYFRNRQLMSEIRLLRGQYQGGGGYL